MIRLALPATLGAILAVSVTWDAGIVAMATSAPLGGSLLALLFALLFSYREPNGTSETQKEAGWIRVYLEASELAELDKWRQSHGKDLTRAEAARILLIEPLISPDEPSKSGLR